MLEAANMETSYFIQALVTVRIILQYSKLQYCRILEKWMKITSED